MHHNLVRITFGLVLLQAFFVQEISSWSQFHNHKILSYGRMCANPTIHQGHQSSFLQKLSARSSSEEPLVKSEATQSKEDWNLPPILDMVITQVGSTTTWVVSGTFFVVLAWQRDALMVSFFIGSIANGVLSKILKKIINQTRPPELEETDLKIKPSDGGMPSSHAMSVGFISTFTAMNLPWAQIPLMIYGILSLTYRVQAKLHTWQQIGVGSVVGCLNGYGWYRLCTGDNPWGVNVMDFVSQKFLNEQGVLPIPLLIVPALVGAATVGSIERRISYYLNNNSKEE